MRSPESVRIPLEVACLTRAVDAGVLGRVEVHFAAWLARTAGITDHAVLLGAAMAVWAARHGHSCLELHRVKDAVTIEQARTLELSSDVVGATIASLEWPDPDAWTEALRRADEVVRTVASHEDGIRWLAGALPAAAAGTTANGSDAPDTPDTPDAPTEGHEEHEEQPDPLDQPLVLLGRRLYLQRYWLDECVIATSLRRHAAAPTHAISPAALGLLDHLLQTAEGGEVEPQRAAADLAVGERLSLIVGGPGTGKTYTVARLLAVLVQDSLDLGTPLRVALAAPSGKAAARLHESILDAVQAGDMQVASEEVRNLLHALRPSTIHGLLGSYRSQRQRFRHDAARPLPHDLVIIDETSMVSLPLLARLVEAIRPDARLVLIGDPDQLESVDLGAVLADLVKASGVDRRHGSDTDPAGPLVGHAVRLTRVHRQEAGSPIGDLAEAIRTGSADEVMRVLSGWADAGDNTHLPSEDPHDGPTLETIRNVVQPVLQQVRAHALAGDAGRALDAMAAIRVLCAHREGTYGVTEWNRIASQWMCGDEPDAMWYPGRPLLITRNDRRLGLANGDTGVVVQVGGTLKAVFHSARRAALDPAQPDPAQPDPAQPDPLQLDPVQLDSVETAFAITIHKSQGSEYDTVVAILPPATSPLATRELLYTGITRAKKRLLVVGSGAAVRQCVLTSSHRMSGLADALA